MPIDFSVKFYYLGCRLRALFYGFFTGISFRAMGLNLKFFGLNSMKIGSNFSLGDNCWIHAVNSYKGVKYFPLLTIGDDVSLSDAVHISCTTQVTIGSGTLIGSCVYIGDHSHGPAKLTAHDILIPPALRPLSDSLPIYIGENVWIGDGAKILAGAVIPSGSIIGANAVVKSKFNEPGLIVGIPGSMKRKF